MSNTSTAAQLFEQWDGQVVPRSFNPGFVTLSYVVSLIGAASTLELINRRTAPKGIFNHLLLAGAAVSMGGISIWCMHYIGNRAIDLAAGETQLQIAYSSGFTALSFFVPIAVLLTAFVAIGTNNTVSWWRVAVGGTLAGAAICGMHYLGNLSINNYVCIYRITNVVGAAVIAVVASIVALSLFFVFRAAWTNSWWKRGLCAIVLAGAVSGMHWCASTGTQYQLTALNTDNNQLSRNTTVIVVICLSVGACLVMAGTAIYSARVMKRYANKAQQVILAAAVFDSQGRILVSPDGLVPSEKITETFLEKTPQDSFTVAHPLFHWMFQASRNWPSISNIIAGMANHLAHLPHSARGIQLINEHGDLIEHYEVVFRELFCTAAQALAGKMKSNLSQVGMLWDEILPTGAGGQLIHRQREIDQILDNEHSAKKADSNDDLAEKGRARSRIQEFGRGSLMFLVRRVESPRELDALEAAGYRFAELHQVSGIISSAMQIKTKNMESKLRHMAAYARAETTMLEPGVHLSLFGVRARVGTFGFDILVRKDARNLLPSVKMPLDALEPGHINFLRQFDRMTPGQITRRLDSLKQLSRQELVFATALFNSLESLRAWIDDPVFDEAMLTTKIVQAPCQQPQRGSASPSTATLITLRILVPIHLNVASPQCEFTPLNFFKVHQLVYANSPHHLAFSQAVHREIAPIINAVPADRPKPGSQSRHRTSLRESRMPKGLRRLRPGTAGTYSEFDPEEGKLHHHQPYTRSSSPRGSTQTGSTIKLWDGRSSSDLRGPSGDSAFEEQKLEGAAGALSQQRQQEQQPSSPPQHAQSFGGILVSQEITIDVHEAGKEPKVQAPRVKVSRVLHRRGSSRGEMDKTDGSAIEMRTLAERTNTNVAAESGGEAATFVDELFAVCVDGR